jgi:phage FluMu gp28-like protein
MNTPPYFLPYQNRWINDTSRLKIMEKSRQIGISFCTAFSAVRRVAQQGARLDVWVSSRDEVQARLFLEDCKKWAETMQVAADARGEMVLDSKGTTGYVLQFANGRSIYSLSSSPNALAGKRGHVILDEFALHADQRLLFQVAKPVTTWGGQLEIISTHRGIDSVFNGILREIVERNNSKGFSHHRVTLQEAVAEGLVEKINEKNGGTESRAEFLARLERECLDEEQWLQEYCCQPCDHSTSFLCYELIKACEVDDCLKDFAYLQACQNPLYLGLDIGRKRDLTIIDVGERIGDVIWDRMRIEMRNTSFSEQEAELYRFLKLRKLQRACIDASGIGMQLAERAREHCGWKIEPVTFTPAVKEQLAYELRAAFQDQRLRIPRDELLLTDLRALRKEITDSGNIRFGGKSDDGHCDRFWAKALRQQASHYRSDCVGALVA